MGTFISSSNKELPGNLTSYARYLRRYFLEQVMNNSSTSKTKIQILQILSEKPNITIWEIAKKPILDNSEKLRSREKKYRKVILGNDDVQNVGLEKLGLVAHSGFNLERGASKTYRLSIYGIFIILEIKDYKKTEIDFVAKNYSKVLPKIFNRWDELKYFFGDDVYKISLLMRGLLLERTNFEESDFPKGDLFAYIFVKYKKCYDKINEEELAEQISLWFYTLINSIYLADKNKKSKKEKACKFYKNNSELLKWYKLFMNESSSYYNSKSQKIKEVKSSFN